MKKFFTIYCSIALLFVSVYAAKGWPIDTVDKVWFLVRVAVYWPLVLTFLLSALVFGW